jgi:photosystem II stability/assembly factor-like uncharacterized protein
VTASETPQFNGSTTTTTTTTASTEEDEDEGEAVAPIGRRVRGLQTSGNYTAQIVKTTDGGATWTTVYLNVGMFSVNAIDCQDTDHCCAAGQYDDGTGAQSGRIICTADGGATWQQNFFNVRAACWMLFNFSVAYLLRHDDASPLLPCTFFAEREGGVQYP